MFRTCGSYFLVHGFHLKILLWHLIHFSDMTQSSIFNATYAWEWETLNADLKVQNVCRYFV